MKKQVTIEQFRKVLSEEIAQRKPEQVKVSYCCPIFLGGYTRDKQAWITCQDQYIYA